MAGKAYTMREMKAIVEYLTERKAFGEVRGRKMWMEFANSEKTSRTWQSLKETFLKRILPDLHNPYYKLTLDQVRSFRQGYDVVEKERNNRLEFRTASEDSSTSDENQKEPDVPSANPNNEAPPAGNDNEPPIITIDDEVEKVTGEGITCAKIPSRSRSSAETVVLENCYENAEELQRVLESPKIDETKQKSKPLKDLLTFEYSEPLTPLVKELLEDFETESETSDKDPELKIVEGNPNTSEDVEPQQNAGEHIPSENRATELEDMAEIEQNALEFDKMTALETSTREIHDKGDEQPNNDKEEDNNNLKTSTDKQNIETSQQIDVTNAQLQDTNRVAAETNAENVEELQNISKNKEFKNQTVRVSENTTQQSSSDTVLPNNQEALNNSKTTPDTKTDIVPKELEKRSAKRSSSQDSKGSKKQKLADDKPDDNVVEENTESVIEINSGMPVTNGSVEPLIEINSDTPIPNQEAMSIIETHSETANQNNDTGSVIEINTDTPTINDTEAQFNALLKSGPENVNKPTTSTQKEVPNITINDDDNEIEQDKNPCLQSVSLFEEQFKTTVYSSDSDDEATPAPKQNIDKQKVHKEKNVLVKKVAEDNPKKDSILKSSIEAETQKQNTETKDKRAKEMKLQRERALANVFGFAHGGASTSRKRRVSHRRSHHHHASKQNASNSSEWTSESDSEAYVSPPRGRKNRQTKKYLKPKCSRILQDPEEGMLYVVFGKNIYPLVKDGKHIKNFVTYRSDSGSDMEDESFWKQKYIEEKKRVEEFKKLLKETREAKTSKPNEPSSPILPSTSNRNGTSARTLRSADKANNKEQSVDQEEKKQESKDDKLVLKLATGNGEELLLQGGWTQISSAIPQMVQFLRSMPSHNNRKTVQNQQDKDHPTNGGERMEISSGQSTPIIITVDPEVHEKVNKIENEIFKEIAQREKDEEVKQNEIDNPNITKRKPTRARKSSTASSTASPTKRARKTKAVSTESKQDVTKSASKKTLNKQLEESKKETESKKQLQVESKEQLKVESLEQEKKSKLKTRQPRASEVKPLKLEETEQKESKQQNDSEKQKQPKRRESLRISKRKGTSEASSERTDISPAGARLSTRQVKTPNRYGTETDSSASGTRLRSRGSAAKEATSIDVLDENARYMFPPTPLKNNKSPRTQKNRSSAKINNNIEKVNIPGNSMDSIQGYQDSDVSPMKINFLKRKRKLSLATHRVHQNRRVTRRKSYPTLLQELSSDSNNSSYFVPLRRSQSTLNSEVYRTDSYQLLAPRKINSFNKMERIDESDPIRLMVDPNIRHFDSVSKETNKSSNDYSNIIVEVASSSNVSFPLSPVLSVVENMSISREIIKNNSHRTLNEIPLYKDSSKIDFDEYMISEVDVSVPLMNQQCELQKSVQAIPSKKKAKESTLLSDTFINKICTVNIEDLTLSQNLDQRLRDLLLESSKKKAKVDEENAMEVDESNVVTTKKRKSTKRSSTPRKNTARKVKAPKGPVIEEEHMETCQYAGRNSCPPLIKVIPADENGNNCVDATLNIKKAKPRIKKDVIKVKIQRPREKRRSIEQIQEKSAVNNGTMSTYTDSGINDTETISELFLKGSDESVDLIHNHSETCLFANECIGDSVEFVENSKSIISLNSSGQTVDSELQRLLEDTEDFCKELLFNNAQKIATTEQKSSDDAFGTPGTAYHSPAASNTSLITEDLSDEPVTQPTKWYLLSEDENTNTQPATSNIISFGANLKHLFPIACAVPDLSTISEMSKENEDSRKPFFDIEGETRDCNLQSPF